MFCHLEKVCDRIGGRPQLGIRTFGEDIVLFELTQKTRTEMHLTKVSLTHRLHWGKFFLLSVVFFCCCEHLAQALGKA